MYVNIFIDGGLLHVQPGPDGRPEPSLSKNPDLGQALAKKCVRVGQA
jgi:hypothetical protein